MYVELEVPTNLRLFVKVVRVGESNAIPQSLP